MYSNNCVVCGTGFFKKPLFNIKLQRPQKNTFNTDFPETLLNMDTYSLDIIKNTL